MQATTECGVGTIGPAHGGFMRLVPLFMLAACSDPARMVGDVPADGASVEEVPVLAHFASASPDVNTVASLFDADLSFDTAPDPTAWLAAEHAAHAALPEASGQELSVLTFNTGLLDRGYLLSRVSVPFMEERAAVMGDEVFGAGHDILFLQEVWEVEDAEALAAAGEAAGYTVIHPRERQEQRETGLVVAVRGELIGGELFSEVVQYDAQWGAENFPGPNLKRGYLHVSFDLADDDVTVHLFDTHLTPFFDKWRTRNLQVRELGLAVADVSSEDLVLLGGDFNAGWYYAENTWTDATGDDHEGWWRNTTMPALLSYYGGLSDLANLAELVPEKERGDAVPTDVDTDWLTEAYGDGSLCDTASHFTATDCNSLYWQNYAATEFPARMDLLFVRDGTGRLRALSRERAFVEKLDFGGAGEFELSDHYGQVVSVTF